MTRRSLRVELRAQVWDASGGVCAYCGLPMHPIRDFTVDHVLPVVDGGTDDLANLVAACVACNMTKGGRSSFDAPRLVRHRRGRRLLPV